MFDYWRYPSAVILEDHLGKEVLHNQYLPHIYGFLLSSLPRGKKKEKKKGRHDSYSDKKSVVRIIFVMKKDVK